MYTVQSERLLCPRCGCSKPESDFSSTSRAQIRSGDPDGMCLVCVNKLYNSAIGRDEIEAYLKEDMDRRNEKNRLPGQQERKESPARWGHSMSSGDFISKLRSICPNLLFRDGNVQGDISVCTIRGNELRYICYFTRGRMPEFEIVITNEQDLPISQKRGWRTVLLRLIKAGVLTEEQARKHFDTPSGEPAKFYLSELQALRTEKLHA